MENDASAGRFLQPLSEGPERRKPGPAKKLFSRGRLLRLLISLSLFSIISFFGLRWVEKSMTFHPDRYTPGIEWTVPAGARDVWFSTADGLRLHGWIFESTTDPKLATVIYFHGNGGNITNVDWVGKQLASRGLSVLLVDYRGYGRSEGEAEDERGIYLDADAAYDFVTSLGRNHPIVLYGQSLGTTAAVDLASRRACGALILESGLSSASDVAATVFPWFPRLFHGVLRSRFESARKLSQVTCPVLITHGEPDPILPAEQSRRLFAAANEPKKLLIFPGAGHNVFGSLGDRYLELVANFIKESLARK
jgi:fermentation-respiration switch protein FrsA (DUF1100 family)